VGGAQTMAITQIENKAFIDLAMRLSTLVLRDCSFGSELEFETTGGGGLQPDPTLGDGRTLAG